MGPQFVGNPQPYFAKPTVAPQAPATWQTPTSPRITAPPAAVVRGVSAEPKGFVLPSPEALGVPLTLTTAPAAAPVAAAVDWNQIQARIDRLGVLKYEKDRVGADQIMVRLLLPTADPRMGQPVVAQAATEAAAVLMALDHAEAWVQKR